MKAYCWACGNEIDIDYFIKGNVKGQKVLQIVFNIQCNKCKAINPISIIPKPIKKEETQDPIKQKILEEKKERELTQLKENADYIG